MQYHSFGTAPVLRWNVPLELALLEQLVRGGLDSLELRLGVRACRSYFDQTQRTDAATPMKSLLEEIVSAGLQGIAERKMPTPADVAVGFGCGWAAKEVVKYGSKAALYAADRAFSKMNEVERPFAHVSWPPLRSREEREAEQQPDPVLVNDLLRLGRPQLKSETARDLSGWSGSSRTRLQAM